LGKFLTQSKWSKILVPITGIISMLLINISVTSLIIPAVLPISKVRVVSDSAGHRLQVNGEDYMIFGMNWDYFPIGTNYTYNLWDKSDAFIEEALQREMTLLKSMGVNTIRQYSDIPPRWVTHIFENYSIFTIINHPFARYGVELEGEWIANVDYSDPNLRHFILTDVAEMVAEFKDTPGVLMWLLGNENNYGLFWKSTETGNIPDGEPLEQIRARQLYSLLNETIETIHDLDDNRPVAIANGDLLFLDIIAEEIDNLDIFGANVYRGASFGDLFDVVHQKLDVPVMFTEFGADAFNVKEMREDEVTQAKYLLANWQEIYEQASGNGKVGNAIGGFTFQFSDGWWKYQQTTNLNIHDTNASWSNGGYLEDLVQGKNNMNEEWFGICEKGVSDDHGFYKLTPRAAYYALQKVHSLNPLSPTINLDQIQYHFSNIKP